MTRKATKIILSKATISFSHSMSSEFAAVVFLFDIPMCKKTIMTKIILRKPVETKRKVPGKISTVALQKSPP